MKFQMFKLVLEKAEETEIKLPTSHWIIEIAREFQKNIYFCFIDYAKAFDNILECEVMWAWGSMTRIKTSGGNRIPVELFQILKDGAVKVLHSICQQIWKTYSGHRSRKGQFSFQSLRKTMPNNVQTIIHLYSSHMIVRLCSKSFKLGFNST